MCMSIVEELKGRHILAENALQTDFYVADEWARSCIVSDVLVHALLTLMPANS